MHLLSEDPYKRSTSLKKKSTSKADVDTEEACAEPNLERTDKSEFFEAGVLAHLDPIDPSLHVDDAGFVTSIFDF